MSFLLLKYLRTSIQLEAKIHISIIFQKTVHYFHFQNFKLCYPYSFHTLNPQAEINS